MEACISEAMRKVSMDVQLMLTDLGCRKCESQSHSVRSGKGTSFMLAGQGQPGNEVCP